MTAVAPWCMFGGLLAFAAMGHVQAQQLIEGFDAAIPPPGWIVRNQSSMIGTTTWFQGDGTFFGPNTGAGYAAADFNSAGGTSIISNWMISPQLTMLRNGNTVSFFTRTFAGALFPDRLELRLCRDVATDSCGLAGSTGTTSTNLGDFTTLLVSVNQTLTVGGYPETFTQFLVTLSGLPEGFNAGRFALRYFVTSGGPTGDNSSYIGVDDFVVSSTVPDLIFASGFDFL